MTGLSVQAKAFLIGATLRDHSFEMMVVYGDEVRALERQAREMRARLFIGRPKLSIARLGRALAPLYDIEKGKRAAAFFRR
jgi:hypothetical protein